VELDGASSERLAEGRGTASPARELIRTQHKSNCDGNASMKTFHPAPNASVIHGDAVEALPLLANDRFDAVVTDPPYEIGYMAKAWDGHGVSYRAAFWRDVLRVLKPGGHLLAFGGTRTYHRMTCAIEDAGFDIRDSLHWLYATGFPKSLNVGTGQGTALKPAHEPIVLARKPFAGTVAQNVQAHGTGALNIGACRIQTADQIEQFAPHPSGRWPPNVLLDSYAAEDLGSPARFFFVAKPSRRERDLGCDALPSVSGGQATDREDGSAGVNNPRAGAGRTGGARNWHPTVKPLTLMRYLVRLVTPPGGCVLDPFAGSGTTGMAAHLEGFGFLGIEAEEAYIPITVARIQGVAK